MSKSIVCEGRTSSEAIEKGLMELNCSANDVDIKILEDEDKKIFFSILDPRVVKVQLTLKENNSNEDSSKHDGYKNEIVVEEEELSLSEEHIKKFLDEFCKEFGDISYKVKNDGKDIICISIDGADSYKLIGYRGDSLNSMQVILNSIGNKGINDRIKVFLDINGYKDRREESLKDLAKRIEKNVAKSKKKVILEPMNSYDRKIIHTVLQDSKDVKTYSIGEEPNRRVVVDLK